MGNKSNKPETVEKGENLIKIILVGEAGSGKTNLINVAVGKEFNPDQLSTSVLSFSSKKFSYKNKNYTLNIWDTVGQERLRSLNNLFYNETKIVIFVYDISVRNSLESLKNYWINEINEKLGKSIIKGICGNKSDLYLYQEVSDIEGKELAGSIGAKFTETSAKDDPNGFIHFIEELATSYIKNPSSLEINGENKIKINKADVKSKKKSKCQN